MPDDNTTIEIDGANFRVAQGLDQVKAELKDLNVGRSVELPLVDGGSIIVNPAACAWIRLSAPQPVEDQFLDPEALAGGGQALLPASPRRDRMV